jgi:hypothetical protein
MDKVFNPILLFLIFSGIVLSSYIGLNFLWLKEKEVNNEARYQCAQSSRYEVTTDSSSIWYPAKDLYEECLNEKGL